MDMERSKERFGAAPDFMTEIEKTARKQAVRELNFRYVLALTNAKPIFEDINHPSSWRKGQLQCSPSIRRKRCNTQFEEDNKVALTRPAFPLHNEQLI